MQIPEDAEPAQPHRTKRRQTATIQKLALRNSREDDTVRLPMSVLAFWREPLNPELDTLRVRLDLPENADDDVTLAGPLPLPEDDGRQS